MITVIRVSWLVSLLKAGILLEVFRCCQVGGQEQNESFLLCTRLIYCSFDDVMGFKTLATVG